VTVNPNHLADIRAGTEAECVRSGSGYRIGPTLVLTARHVLLDDDGGILPKVEVWLGHPEFGSPRPYPAQVVDWRPPGGLDVALLRIAGAPAYGPPVHWGRLTGTDTVPYTGLGFPHFAEYTPGDRNVEQLTGNLNPLSIGPDGCIPIDQDAHPVTGHAAGGDRRVRHWSGVSGAAIFSNPPPSSSGAVRRLLIGVVVADDTEFGGARLHAVPVAALWRDERFTALLAADTGARPVLESVELQGLLRPERRAHPAGTPGSLLAADREIVPFQGREDLLRRLSEWRDAPEPFGIQLITGEGGQGKTRLAREFAARCPSDWVVGFLDAPHPSLEENGGPTAEVIARLCRTAKPVLVIADYAESTPQRVSALVQALLSNAPQRPVRLLLLARSAQHWWDTLRSQLEKEHPNALSPPIQLGPLLPATAGPDARLEEFARALAAFAPHLSAFPELPSADWAALARQVRANRPDLDDEQFGNVLNLHMTALIALLRAATGQDPSLITDPEQELAAHERGYLHRVARRQGLLDPGVLSDRTDPDRRRVEALRALDRALAAAILTGPCDDDRARAVAGLASERHAEDVAGWLATLYPPAPEEHAAGIAIGVVMPDRLAERLVGEILTEQPGTLDRITPLVGDTDTAQRCLTVLARAAVRPAFRTELDDQIEHLIAGAPERYAAAAQFTALAVERPDPLINGLLVLGHRDAEEFQRQIAQVADGLPEQSVKHAWLLVDIAQLHAQLLAALADSDPDAYLPALAASLTNLGIRLQNVGRLQAGLVIHQAATKLYKAAALRDGRYLPDLITAHQNLAIPANALGLKKGAFPMSRDVVEAFEVLAEVDRDTFLPHLASALNNYAALAAQSGRRKEALATFRRAREMFEELAARDPDVFLPRIAGVFDNISILLGEMGKQKEGLAAARRAVEIFERLVQRDADAYLPDLAKAVRNLAARLVGVGQHTEALAASERAVELTERIAEVNPDPVLMELVIAVHNHAVILALLGRGEEASAAARRARELYGQAVQVNPDVANAKLESSLNQFPNQLSEIKRLKEVQAAAERAVVLYKQLAKNGRAANKQDLAESLIVISNRFSEMGSPVAAFAAAHRAVKLLERLSKRDPDANLPSLAWALYNLANSHRSIGRRKAASKAYRRAIEIYERLAEDDPDAFRPGLAMSLHNLAIVLGELERPAEGMVAARRAVEIYERLAEDRPEDFLPDLAEALSTLSHRLALTGRQQEAVAAAARAVEIYERLAESDPERYRQDHLSSLVNLALWKINNVGFARELNRLVKAFSAAVSGSAVDRASLKERVDSLLRSDALADQADREMVKELVDMLFHAYEIDAEGAAQARDGEEQHDRAGVDVPDIGGASTRRPRRQNWIGRMLRRNR